MRLPNKFSEQARKEKGKGIMRMGMVFSCPFQGALWKLAYNTPCLSQNTEMRSGETHVLTLRMAVLRLKVFVLSQEIPNLATVSRCSKLFYNMKAAKEQFDMIE